MTDSDFTCQFCHKTFPTYRVLRSHQGSLHKPESVQIAYKARLKRNRERRKAKNPRTIPCPSCPRLFVTNQALNEHIWWLH